MSSPASPETSSRIKLALSKRDSDLGEVTDWAGPLVALGSLARRFIGQLDQRQLVVAISVPRREFAAVLIALGWVLRCKSTPTSSAKDVLKRIEAGTPIRLVTDQFVITDYFKGIDTESTPTCVELSRNSWFLSKIEAVSVLTELETPLRTERLGIGSVGHWAGLTQRWSAHLAAPERDIAIIGTQKWIREDTRTFVSLLGANSSAKVELESALLASLILPEHRDSATWSTHLYSSSRIADELPLPEDIQATVLDGYGAIKYLDAIESKLVVCVLDRSVADEAADEMLVQRRNTRSEPVSLRDDLGWRPLPGMEALAFTVAL